MVAKHTKPQTNRYSVKHSVESVSWAEVEILVDEIVADIKRKYKSIPFHSIFGVPRGGLIVAVLLSHRLSIPVVVEPNWRSLVVDDVVDTGEALKGYEGHTIAVLHAKPWCKIKPDFCGAITEAWTHYPWEMSSKQKKDYTHG